MWKVIRVVSKKLFIKSLYVKVSLDEVMCGVFGSFNIVEKIMEKIRGVDVFVVDIIIVMFLGMVWFCVNLNVFFEFGYVVVELGWDRVVLLFN